MGWKFLPYKGKIPRWGGIPPQLGTTSLNCLFAPGSKYMTETIIIGLHRHFNIILLLLHMFLPNTALNFNSVNAYLRTPSANCGFVVCFGWAWLCSDVAKKY